MKHTEQLAKHFRDVHFGGNWTSVNLRDTLAGVTWEEATRQLGSCNTIAVLVFHINYYVSAVLKVLQGGPLEAHDTFSFDAPPVRSDDDWQQLKDKAVADAEKFAAQVARLADEKLFDSMADPKYGTWYRNLLGITEHTHYHLGQIVVLKKIIRENVLP